MRTVLRTAVLALLLAAIVAAPAAAAKVKRGDVLVVRATAFNDSGLTYSGVPTGPGICAVDPTVIPLGSRFRVQHYGVCLAADIGGAIKGRAIDVWFRSDARVYRWGVRRVKITILCVRCRAGA